jgi:hypothetical protein
MSETPPGQLVEKYRTLATELNDLRTRLRVGEQRLAHLRTAIQLFDANFRFSDLAIKRVPTGKQDMSESTRAMWDILRTAKEPVSAHGISECECLGFPGKEEVLGHKATYRM